MGKKRTDAERRARQCERMARLMKVLRLLVGHGRWNVDDLAQELECSRRTIHRDLEVLSMSGVPIHYDRSCEAYRVPDKYRFPGIEPKNPLAPGSPGTKLTVNDINKLIEQMEQTLEQLKTLRNKIAQ